MPVTLDFSKAQPIKPQNSGGISLDFSKAQPVTPAGATGPLPGVPAAPIPAGLQGPPAPALKSGLGAAIAEGAGDVGMGVLKGALNTATALPAYLAQKTGYANPQKIAERQRITAPSNTAQSIGKGAEQIGEFFLPGLGEEKAAAAGAKVLPIAESIARPLTRLAYQAGTTGAVNAAQGGSFKTGAETGLGGGVLGEGLRAAAPYLAESALNIRKLDRAYGKGGGTIGRAILDETSGYRPGTVAASAQERLNQLNPELERLADAASVRPNPVRLALPPPAEAVSLGETGVPQMQGGLVSASKFPVRNIVPEPNASYIAGGVPARNAFMAGEGEVLPPVGNQRIGAATWMRRPEVDMSPLPDTIPNRSASLRPALNVLGSAAGTATKQGERSTLGQLQPMMTHLGETVTGEPIPENITPRQLLDLKRGFGNEFIHRWNPEIMEGVKGTAAQAYHAMGNEFNQAVPGAADLNTRMSRLIPVAKRGESAELNAPTLQRIAHRVGAHTGALTGAAYGGLAGYREDGLPGAIGGGLLGLAVPEFVASPTGEMVGARAMNSGVIPRFLTGAGLQFDRRKK